MKLITTKQQAAQAADKWKRTYFNEDSRQWYKYVFEHLTKKERYEALVALGPEPRPEDVETIIGNRSWTRIRCSECGKEAGEVVEVGEEPDYESSTTWLCKDCLRKALNLMEEEEEA
jgi:hypothetical protein